MRMLENGEYNRLIAALMERDRVDDAVLAIKLASDRYRAYGPNRMYGTVWENVSGPKPWEKSASA